MNLRAGLLALLALPMAACAVVPVEDRDRRINLKWDLTPSDTTLIKRMVESGDIILSWTAQAKATHAMTLAGGSTPLTAARTTYGQIYCAAKNCYEDRDGDGALDHMWDVSRNGAAPNEPRSVTNAEPLKTPIAFHSIETSGATIFEQLLGLVYSGPVQGLPKEDQTLMPMVGELSVGWHGGPKVARTPDGGGWSEQQSLPLVIGEDFAPRVSVSPLGLTFKPLRATIDGMLELEVQAKPAEGVDLAAKPKFDIEENPAPPEPTKTRLSPEA